MKETPARSVLFTSAIVVFILLLSACGPPPPIHETLPERLTDREFWDLINDFSEPGGYFRSDNFLSNESGYQTIIPKLREKLKPGGVYIGVGPEQNFTYLVALQPKIAFIVDIRRQNMLEHLFYKALMETSADRAEFLSRLFSQPHRVELAANSGPEALFRAYESVRASSIFFEKNLQSVVDYLENQKGFKFSMEDESSIRNVAHAFFSSGPALRYTFIGGYGGYMSMPSYSELMTETDADLKNWNFLGTEDQFRMIQNMQKSNLIVPLVGDFGGPKAIRAVGTYIKDHGSTVRAFYTSNVEQYLFQDEKWQRFYDNVAFLPADSTSTFIRYSLASWRFGHPRTSLTSGIWSTLGAYRSDRIKGYYDVIGLSR
jgi:hypothetical protein